MIKLSIPDFKNLHYLSVGHETYRKVEVKSRGIIHKFQISSQTFCKYFFVFIDDVDGKRSIFTVFYMQTIYGQKLSKPPMPGMHQ